MDEDNMKKGKKKKSVKRLIFVLNGNFNNGIYILCNIKFY